VVLVGDKDYDQGHVVKVGGEGGREGGEGGRGGSCVFVCQLKEYKSDNLRRGGEEGGKKERAREGGREDGWVVLCLAVELKFKRNILLRGHTQRNVPVDFKYHIATKHPSLPPSLFPSLPPSLPACLPAR